jgi:hemerythrin-like domain-containing protein
MLINLGPAKEGAPLNWRPSAHTVAGNAADIVDVLVECHDRIRSFIDLARHIALAYAVSHDDIGEAAQRVVRYFSEALPLHVVDEEESIVPRLTGRDAALDAALNTMRREHEEHKLDLELLLRTCRMLMDSPERLPALRETVLGAASSLQQQFVRHLEHEEQTIFPAVRTLLSPADHKAMLREFRVRRRVMPDTVPGSGIVLREAYPHQLPPSLAPDTPGKRP